MHFMRRIAWRIWELDRTAPSQWTGSRSSIMLLRIARSSTSDEPMEPFPTRWFSITSLHVLFATATPFVYFDTLNLNTISGHLFHDLPNTHAGRIKRQVVCRLYQGRRPAWRPPRWNVMAAEVLRRDSCVKTVWEHCICQVVVSQTKEASVGRLRLPCRTRLPSDFTIAFDFLHHPSLR